MTEQLMAAPKELRTAQKTGHWKEKTKGEMTEMLMAVDWERQKVTLMEK